MPSPEMRLAKDMTWGEKFWLHFSSIREVGSLADDAQICVNIIRSKVAAYLNLPVATKSLVDLPLAIVTRGRRPG